MMQRLSDHDKADKLKLYKSTYASSKFLIWLPLWISYGIRVCQLANKPIKIFGLLNNYISHYKLLHVLY